MRTASSFLRATVLASATMLLIQGLALRSLRSDLAEQDLAPQAADGSLDPTFGSGGKVTTDFSGRGDFATAIAIQSDGRILVAGGRDDSGTPRRFALARYNQDGSLDTSFGSGGKVTADFFGTPGVADGIAVQSDGKVVVVGGASDQQGNAVFGIARFNPDGSLDASFGSSGKVTTRFSGDSSADAVRITPNGKFIVSGFTDAGGTHAALARYNTDGSLDTGFGSGGKVISNTLLIEASALVIQPDNKIVVGGSATPDVTKPERFCLVRYNGDGTLDTAFGTNGAAITDFFAPGVSGVHGIALQQDGKIVAAGEVQLGASVDTIDFALARFNTDGTLDAAFNGGGLLIDDSSAGPDRSSVALTHPLGTITTDFFGHFDNAAAIAIQGDGKIVAAGAARATASQDSLDFAMARYNTDGSLDSSFGTGGRQVTDFFGHFDTADAIVFQTNGDIVLAGEAFSSSTFVSADIALARYTVASDFALEFNQSVINGDRGTKVTVDVLIKRTGGFTGNVTVTSPDLSAIGVKVKPPDPISTTDPSVRVKLKIKAGASVGPHQVVFTGKDDAGRTRTASLTLNIS